MANGKARSVDRRKQMERPVIAANDNRSRKLTIEPSMSGNGLEVPARETTNGHELSTVTTGAANDNAVQTSAPPTPANDNIRVSDDLPRPLPPMPGEGDLVKTLLGKRFQQILKGEEP